VSRRNTKRRRRVGGAGPPVPARRCRPSGPPGTATGSANPSPAGAAAGSRRPAASPSSPGTAGGGPEASGVGPRNRPLGAVRMAGRAPVGWTVPYSVSGTIALAVLDIAETEIAKTAKVDDKIKLMREFAKASNRINRPQVVVAVLGFLAVLMLSAAAVACAVLGYGHWSWIPLLTASGGGVLAFLYRGRPPGSTRSTSVRPR